MPDKYDTLYFRRGAAEAFCIASDDARKLRAELEEAKRTINLMIEGAHDAKIKNEALAENLTEAVRKACRATDMVRAFKEWLEENGHYRDGDNHPADLHYQCYACGMIDRAELVLSGTTPCPHTERVKVLEEAVRWACSEGVHRFVFWEESWPTYVAELRSRAFPKNAHSTATGTKV